MKSALRDLCGALCAVLSAMATLSAFTAVTSGDRNMYLTAIVFGLASVGVALSVLLRM